MNQEEPCTNKNLENCFLKCFDPNQIQSVNLKNRAMGYQTPSSWLHSTDFRYPGWKRVICFVLPIFQEIKRLAPFSSIVPTVRTHCPSPSWHSCHCNWPGQEGFGETPACLRLSSVAVVRVPGQEEKLGLGLPASVLAHLSCATLTALTAS